MGKKTKLVSTWIEPEDYNKLNYLAHRWDRTISYLIRWAIEDFVDKYYEKEKRLEEQEKKKATGGLFS